MIAKYAIPALLAASAALGLALGIQSWRLDNCQSAHKLTKQTLETVRGDRDAAVAVGNENAAANATLTGRLNACVASSEADIAKAQNEAKEAIKDRELLEEQMAQERAERELLYANDPKCAEWRAALICPSLEQRLRDSRAASRNKN